MNKKLYIFRGLPGSGKSTFARELASLVVEPDMFRYDANNRYVFDSDCNDMVNKKAYELLRFAMKLEMPALAITATHVKVSHIMRYVKLGQKYGYSICVVECTGDYGSIHNVPLDVMARMAKEFEPMTPYDVSKLGISIMRRNQCKDI